MLSGFSIPPLYNVDARAAEQTGYGVIPLFTKVTKVNIFFTRRLARFFLPTILVFTYAF